MLLSNDVIIEMWDYGQIVGLYLFICFPAATILSCCYNGIGIQGDLRSFKKFPDKCWTVVRKEVNGILYNATQLSKSKDAKCKAVILKEGTALSRLKY